VLITGSIYIVYPMDPMTFWVEDVSVGSLVEPWVSCFDSVPVADAVVGFDAANAVSVGVAVDVVGFEVTVSTLRVCFGGQSLHSVMVVVVDEPVGSLLDAEQVEVGMVLVAVHSVEAMTVAVVDEFGDLGVAEIAADSDSADSDFDSDSADVVVSVLDVEAESVGIERVAAVVVEQYWSPEVVRRN